MRLLFVLMAVVGIACSRRGIPRRTCRAWNGWRYRDIHRLASQLEARAR